MPGTGCAAVFSFLFGWIWRCGGGIEGAGGVFVRRKKWYNRNVNREAGEMMGRREGEGRLEEGRIV